MPTPAQVLSTVRNQIYETTEGFYTDPEIYSYMWQAEIELAKLLKCGATTSTSISTVASQREYTKPTGCLNISRVTWNDMPLKKIELSEIDVTEGTGYDFTGTTGNPDSFYEFEGSIGLSPIPDSVDTLKLWYVPTPTEITATSTAFTVPADFGFYLSDYCLYRMCLKDDDQGKAGPYLQTWEQNKIKALSEWRKRNTGNKHVVVKDVNLYPSTNLGTI